jgi:hypothetical protein
MTARPFRNELRVAGQGLMSRIPRFRFLVMASCVVLSSCGSEPRINGDAIAKDLIRNSQGGSQSVDLRTFGDKICFSPEGASARFIAERQFSGFRVEFEESDKSQGFWFFIVGNEKSRAVKIFAIDQRTLKWPISADEPLYKNVVCPTSLRVKHGAGTPQISM